MSRLQAMSYNRSAAALCLSGSVKGCLACLDLLRCSALLSPTSWSNKRGGRFGAARPRISRSSVRNWSCSCTSTHAWPMKRPGNESACRDDKSGAGGNVGLPVTFPWPMPRGGVARPIFPPLDHALVKAVACELVAQTKQPLSRQSLADVTARVRTVLGTPISRSTVWRILATDAIKPWRYKYWIFPRDPHFADKAGPMLDLYAGRWQGEPLGPKDHILSADEKTSIQARRRCHPALPPAPGRAASIENRVVPE